MPADELPFVLDVAIDGRVPDPEREKDPVRRAAMERALTYMGLTPDAPITSVFRVPPASPIVSVRSVWLCSRSLT